MEGHDMTNGQTGPGAAERSLLGAGMVIRGTIDAPGIVEISGSLEGGISAEAIVVEANGKVTGTLAARRVTIRGRVEGDIATEELRILNGAVVTGQVTTGTLTIEAGAEVDFSCKMTAGRSGA